MHDQPQTYLDYAASAPLDPRVAAAMIEAQQLVGNPSAVHGYGRAARAAVDAARASVARLLGVQPDAVIFTSGATEANAIALFGSWKGGRILTGPAEHSSVSQNVALLSSRAGTQIDVMPTAGYGVVDVAAAAAAIGPKTTLVTLQWVNNVLGTVQPVTAVGAAVMNERNGRGPGDPTIIFHCDAVQALGSLPLNAAGTGIDLLTVSAHKVGGPKGVGALVRVTRNGTVWPLYAGGGQENGLRNGTENVAAIVGFGKAAEILLDERVADIERLKKLNAAFREELAAATKEAEMVEAGEAVPNILFVRHKRLPGDRLMLALDVAGFAVSAGSACDAGTRKTSRALQIALNEKAALHGGVRVSFGRGSTEEQLRACARAIAAAR